LVQLSRWFKGLATREICARAMSIDVCKATLMVATTFTTDGTSTCKENSVGSTELTFIKTWNVMLAEIGA